ncbi:unnamed protein product [Auanema sp. JU1783]|nr:unnamed protein product [Auanema sp. JU1783]
MELILVVLSSLSIFGFVLIFTSLYLIICVPTKLSTLSRFAIHGHNLVAGFVQIYLALVVTPTITLPCIAGYVNGLFSDLRIMSPVNQFWTLITNIYILGWFAVLISLTRVFAISVRASEKTKMIVKAHVAHLFINVIVFIVTGLNLTDDGIEGALVCEKLIHGEVPEELFDTDRGLKFILSKQPSLLIMIYNISFIAITSTSSIVACGAFLIRSLREQKHSARSSPFRVNQRRLTTGVLYLSFFMILGLAIPISIVSCCVYFSICTTPTSHICCFAGSIYPVFSSYSLLMSSADYRNELNRILKKFKFKHSHLIAQSIRDVLEEIERLQNLRSSKRKSMIPYRLDSIINTSQFLPYLT